MKVTKALVQPSVRAVANFTPSTIRSALTLLAQGRFDRAAHLADQIIGDDRVTAASVVRFKGMLGLPLEVTPADESETAKAQAELLEKTWPKILPKSTTFELLQYGYLLGAVPLEIVWDTTGDTWIPTVNVWHPSLMRFDQDKRQWLIKVGEDAKELDLFESGFTLFTPYGGARPWNSGLVRTLAIPWLMKTYAQGDWAGYSEVHGKPKPVATHPAGAKTDQIKQFTQDVYDMGSDGVLTMPEGWDAKLLEATADTWKSFGGLIDWCDKAMSIAMLGQNLTTDVGGGSLAAATVHANVLKDIIEGDAGAEAEVAQPLVGEWTLHNFGEGVEPPHAERDVEPPSEAPRIEEYHLRSGYIRANELRASLSLPPLSEEEGGEEFVLLQEAQSQDEPPANEPDEPTVEPEEEDEDE